MTRSFAMALSLCLLWIPFWSSDFAAIAQENCQSTESLLASVVPERENELECLIEREETLQIFEITNGRMAEAPSTSFDLNDRVAVCVSVPARLYVSLWDVAPNGSVERLFPNSISHSDSTKAALIDQGEPECIGRPGSGYQIEISNHEGRGVGKFYILATESLEAHPDSDGFLISDWASLRASVVREDGVVALEDQPGKMDGGVSYRVR